MGNWKTNKGLVIGDGYADQVGDFVNKAWDKVKKAYPEITKEQFAETMKFCLNSYTKHKEGQIDFKKGKSD